MENIIDNLLNKSKENFMMAIEIYNKPTIHYRVEGFCFFICNSWELMLKAHMIDKLGEVSIYYKNNSSRTLTLKKCISIIFTNEKAPLRLNLEKIIELRNTSTYFITEEYELIYLPLFQSCIFNFMEKMYEFHNIDMTTITPWSFLMWTMNRNMININEIRAKYTGEIANKLINVSTDISSLSSQNNHTFSVKVECFNCITKDKNKGGGITYISNETKNQIKMRQEAEDPNSTHKYNMKSCNKEINKRLKTLGINLKFNKYHFELFCKYYNLKKNPKLCYTYNVNSSPNYSYSLQTIDFIVDEIKKDPKNIIQNLREKIKK